MRGAFGWTFLGWPDGGPTSEQENCVVEITRLLISELSRVENGDQ